MIEWQFWTLIGVLVLHGWSYDWWRQRQEKRADSRAAVLQKLLAELGSTVQQLRDLAETAYADRPH